QTHRHTTSEDTFGVQPGQTHRHTDTQHQKIRLGCSLDRHTDTQTHRHTTSEDTLGVQPGQTHRHTDTQTHTPSTIIDDQLQGTTEKSGTITITIKDTHSGVTHTHRDTDLTVLPSTHITIK